MGGIITDLKARAIIDSRGNPTVEVDCFVDGILMGRAAVPSGASTGSHEAVELRDGEKDWMGKGVSKAVNNVNKEIRNLLVGLDVFNQEEIKTVHCNKESKKGCNGKSTKCITHYLWDELDLYINDFFEKKNLSDLAKLGSRKEF